MTGIGILSSGFLTPSGNRASWMSGNNQGEVGYPDFFDVKRRKRFLCGGCGIFQKILFSSDAAFLIGG
jgi:hypothetical protein